MKNNYNNKYKNFLDFNKDSCHLTEYVLHNTNGLSITQKVEFARRVFTKDVLNSCITIGLLSEDIKNLLGSKTNILNFSMDNMIKNKLSHPEVTDKDYAKIPNIIKYPSKYFKSKNGYDVILFKADEKYYKLVIKTTHNKKENFVKSLHLLNKDRYDKY